MLSLYSLYRDGVVKIWLNASQTDAAGSVLCCALSLKVSYFMTLNEIVYAPYSHTYCHTYYYWYSITHSLFHSRLKSFLFCKSSLPQPFLFIIQVSLYGFPRLFTLVLSISVFLLFLFLNFFSCRFPCGRLS